MTGRAIAKELGIPSSTAFKLIGQLSHEGVPFPPGGPGRARSESHVTPRAILKWAPLPAVFCMFDIHEVSRTSGERVL